MVKRTNPKLIGIFILTAFFIFISTFLLVNRDNLFSRSVKSVLFFPGSIKGLNVGAPVMFNGVQIGRVVRIALVSETASLDVKMPVFIEINPKSFIVLDSKSHKREKLKEMMERLIAKGLRARLQMQSLLTGQMSIGMSFVPDSPVVLTGHTLKIIEIPTLPSIGEEWMQTLQHLPLEEIGNNMNTLLEESIKLVKSVNKDSSQVMNDVSRLTHSMSNVSEKVEKSLESFDEDSRMMLELNKMFRDIGQAALSLRNWADYLERHPEALLRGKGSM